MGCLVGRGMLVPVSVLCTPSYPFLEPTHSRVVPSGTSRVSQGLAMPCTVAESCSNGRAAMALSRAGHLPRDFFASPWGPQALHKGKVMPLLCHQGD